MRIRRPIFITGIVLVVLLLLIISAVVGLYVIVPAVIRSTIDKAEMSFSSVSIEQIEEASFRLRAVLVLSKTGAISASIIAPLKINVNDVGEVVNSQTIKIDGGSNATIVPIDSPFSITNMLSFQNFSHSLIFEANVMWHLSATATVQPLGSFMPSYSSIPFIKNVTLTALNGLSNVTVESVNFNRSDDHQILTDIVINIYNPSVFSIDLGSQTT